MSHHTESIANGTFNEKHSLTLRVWHWLTFVTMTASLVMVLLASTMFRTRDNISLVQEQLEHKGATVTSDQARSVAHEYSDKLWMAHKWIGYGLCFLLLSRVIIEVAQPSDEKFRTRIKKALGATNDSDRNHYLSVKRGYLVFYLLFLIMALTGLGLAFEDVPWLDSVHRPIKNIHEFVQYLIYAYIVVHLVGVVRADTGKYQGLISGMIHGKAR
jgi:cytochrome b561